MGSLAIAWRTEDEANDFGPESGRIGDLVAIAGGSHVFNALERTMYGVAKITDVPDGAIDTIQNRMQRAIWKATAIKDNGDGTVMVEFKKRPIHFLRRYFISKAKCLTEWPGAATLINNLFNPNVTVAAGDVPSLSWTKFKTVFYDRVKEEFVSDLGS